MLTTADSIDANASKILSISRSTQALILNRRKKISTSIILTTIASPHNPSDNDSNSENISVSRDDIYSPINGIKTAATLSGMLILVIIVILWKSRSRNCRFSIFSTMKKNRTMNYPRLSATSFDLEYWLKQVEIREARETARLRTAVSPYLELPKEEPRDNQQATASWISHSWQHWYIYHYQPRFTIQPSAQSSYPTCTRRSRTYFVFNRLFRRLINATNHSRTSMLNGVYADVLDHDFLPISTIYDLRPRRVASWPCVQAVSHASNGTVSALQLQRARQHLLERTLKHIEHI